MLGKRRRRSGGRTLVGRRFHRERDGPRLGKPPVLCPTKPWTGGIPSTNRLQHAKSQGADQPPLQQSPKGRAEPGASNSLIRIVIDAPQTA